MAVVIEGEDQKIITWRFTGRALHAFGESIACTSLVRNEENRQRGPGELIRTFGSTHPHGMPYQPRPFPPGVWAVTSVTHYGIDSPYWPAFIATEAFQILPAWQLNRDGEYLQALPGRTFVGRGYGFHHARFRDARGRLVPSRTTLGCGNILEPNDNRWLAQEATAAMSRGWRIAVHIPQWDEWE